MHVRTALTTIACLLAVNAAAGDLDASIDACNGCHGENGVSQWSDMPTIAGIDAFVHTEALYVYQDEARPCEKSKYRQGDTSRAAASMCEIAAGLSDEEIEALADHYAALPFVPAEQSFDADLATAGMAIHDADCSRCHSDGGSNPDDEASILAGQQMGYLKRSLEEFRAGDRDKPKLGQEKIAVLDDEQIRALVHYYASQQ